MIESKSLISHLCTAAALLHYVQYGMKVVRVTIRDPMTARTTSMQSHESLERSGDKHKIIPKMTTHLKTKNNAGQGRGQGGDAGAGAG